MLSASEILTDMKVKVTSGEFHRAHEIASKAEETVAKDELTSLSTEKLVGLLHDLENAQRLTDAETGPDRMYAHSYMTSIGIVKAEISRR